MTEQGQTTIFGRDACGCDWYTEDRRVIAITCCASHREKLFGYLGPICRVAGLELEIRSAHDVTLRDVAIACGRFWREVGKALQRDAAGVLRQLRRVWGRRR